MRRVLRHVHAQARELSRHPLFTEWLENASVEPRNKLLFAPAAIDFVMGFRDFNKYYVWYPAPRNAFEEALNAHATEDMTHSALFTRDWEILDIDGHLGWAPRDLYWWMTGPETEASRRLDFELVSLVHHHPDPFLRFAIVEAMEAAGNVFFNRTVRVVEPLEAATGTPHPYFGSYHLHRESGHLQNADERMFTRAELDEGTRGRAEALVTRVFEIFHAHFHAWVALARRIEDGTWSYRPAEQARACATLREDCPVDVSAYMSLIHPPGLTGPGAELAERRARAFEDVWQTPFYRWVREAWPGDFKRMTRYFLLQWIVDNWTCSDYFAFDTTYPAPSTPLERGINRLSALYASEMNRRYVEWEILEFDEYTGWSVCEALEHYWLDEDVEQHRKVFADLRKLTFKYPEPLYRYWIMKCFVRFGDALMHSLGVAMRNAAVPDEDFITFAGFPERLHPDLPPDPEADLAVAELERQPISAAQYAVIREIVDETRAQEIERADISWRIVQGKRYDVLDRRWEAARAARTAACAE